IHVGVIFDMAAERTVEIPEPVRTEFVPPGSPKRLIACLDEARSGEHEFGRAAKVEGKMLAALHVRRRLDEEERVVVLRPRRTQKRAGIEQPVGDLEAEPFGVERFAYCQI